MLRFELTAIFLNRFRQQPRLEDSRILLNEEVVESYESVDSLSLTPWSLERFRIGFLVASVESGGISPVTLECG
jgi:hypothetical protein